MIIPSDHEAQCDTTKTLEHLDDAVVTPTTFDKKNQTFTGAVYNQTGRLVSASQRTKENVAWVPQDPNHLDVTDSAAEISGRCLYLGHYTGHYGHFLLESLSRFWALKEDTLYDKFIYHPFVHKVPNPKFYSPAKVCFECFGIEQKRVIIVSRPLKFKHLTVPSTLFWINNQADEDQAKIYRQIGDYCEEADSGKSLLIGKILPPRFRRITNIRRLYLSRRKFRGSHYVKNEDEIERIFSSLGFTIIYPEHLSFERQVAMFRQADIVAGLAGSAMHNTVFMKNGALAITIGDGRWKDISNRNQRICDMLSGVESASIRFEQRARRSNAKNLEFDTSYLRTELSKLL